MRIAIVKSTVNGKYGYCPESAVAILKPQYDDEAMYDTVFDTMVAIRNDKTIPKGTPIVVEK